MHTAFGVSLRSADAGRQVGAVIALSSGEILSSGANEVPKFGGGEYWVGDKSDSRDFRMGYDYNKKQTRRTLSELLTVLAGNGHLTDDLAAMENEDRLRLCSRRTR